MDSWALPYAQDRRSIACLIHSSSLIRRTCNHAPRFVPSAIWSSPFIAFSPLCYYSAPSSHRPLTSPPPPSQRVNPLSGYLRAATGLTDTSMHSDGDGTSVDISCPASSQSMRARGNARPTSSRPPLKSCIANGDPSKPSRTVSFDTPVHGEARWYCPILKDTTILSINQCTSFVLSSVLILAITIWATLLDLVARLLRLLLEESASVEQATYTWDNPKYLNEECTNDMRYYARNAGEGYDIVDEEVETEDGFLLRVHRVVNPRHKTKPNGRGGYPVLILPGLFVSSGAFITSEERSLAFWLSEHGGYQVFLGNMRGAFNMGHKKLSRDDPRFWDWTVRELAMYDLPTLVEYICDATGYDKIAFIGHSQGNGIAFLALSEGMRPELGAKLSCIIALAPVVYAGPLLSGFPFNVLSRIEWERWRVLFGILDFIPFMQFAYKWVHPNVFTFFAYRVFAYLFAWTDAHWLKRRKAKIFRFMPTHVSSASIFWWCGKGGFAQRKCTMDETFPRWFNDENFPPLAIYYGGRDYLVATEPLLERIHEREKCVKLVRVEKVPTYEHCDFYLAADAVERCFSSFIEDIEKTQTDTVEKVMINGVSHFVPHLPFL